MSRSGEYRYQQEGYKVFIPKDLPPEPQLDIDDEMVVLLSHADRELGRLDGATETLPDPDLFVFIYQRREAVLSSQIEGTQASLLDIFEFEANALKPDSPQDVGEVVNYIGAMDYGLAYLQDHRLSLELIRELHKRLLAGTRGGDRNPGEFRQSQNWIGTKGSSIREAVFVPPPPEFVNGGLSRLIDFIHEPSRIPPLIKVALAHAQFETIHPFLDGNGRIGRLLVTLILCEKKILNRPLLYLSIYFKRLRSEYYARLQDVRDKGDWENWLKFFLIGVHEVAREATQTARNIVGLREQHRLLLLDKLGRNAGNALSLLESLYKRPIVSVDYVKEKTNLSYTNANQLVKRFVKLGLLKEITGRPRYRQFAYEPYFALITERE